MTVSSCSHDLPISILLLLHLCPLWVDCVYKYGPDVGFSSSAMDRTVLLLVLCLQVLLLVTVFTPVDAGPQINAEPSYGQVRRSTAFHIVHIVLRLMWSCSNYKGYG